MVISQGEIWWADLPAPTGSGPGFRRPVIVVQCDALNGSRLATTVCVPLTSNLKWGTAPGNVTLSARLTGLPKDSGSQRLSNRHRGQRSPNRAGWETPAPKAGVTAFWNRRCAWEVVLAPLLSHLTGPASSGEASRVVVTLPREPQV